MEIDLALAQQLNERLGIFLNILRPPASDEGGGVKLGIQKAGRNASAIYVGECSGFPWYRLDESQKQSPIEEDSIVGTIVGIALRVQHNDKHGDKVKIAFNVDCGKEKYRLISGVDTVFSRSVVASLLSGGFTKETLVRITLKLGEDGKVVLPSVFFAESGQLVIAGKGLVTVENAEAKAEECAAKLGVAFKGLGEPAAGGAPIGEPPQKPSAFHSQKSRQSVTPPPAEDDVPF